MTQIQLNIDDIDVHYGREIAVKNFSLKLLKGEICALLGSSGCGKTTLQRAIAGFEPIKKGKIELAGQLVSAEKHQVKPEYRRVGMVFQDFALFPHLTVEKNIGLGLKKLNREERDQRIDELLELVDLKDHSGKYPHEISGGQQQRVALARAIAPKPEIILLDEPFSSLDAALRETIVQDVRKLLKEHAMTAILVTHDQHEAFAIADKIGVMEKGELLQWDTPYNIYHNPKSRFVANFIGSGTLLDAMVNDEGNLINGLGIIAQDKTWQSNTRYSVLVRPDDIVFDSESEQKYPIKDKIFRGAEYLYTLKLPDSQHVLCETPSHVDFEIGESLPVKTDFRHLVVFSD